MMRRIHIITLILLLISISFIHAQARSAKEYYLAGIRAYQVQDCRNAVKWLKKALVEDPSLEYYDPDVKFKIGYCAYKIGDYETAKDFLSLYPNNAIAVSIIKAIQEGKKEEEWEKWLMLPKTEETATKTTSKAEEEQPKPSFFSSNLKLYIIVAGTFGIVFFIVFFFEARTGFITAALVKMAGGKVSIEQVEVPEEGIVEEIEKVQPEEVEKEIDLDEIFNSPLDVVDRLIYGEEGFVSEKEIPEVKEEVKEEEAEAKEKEEVEEKPEASEKEAIVEELTEPLEVKESLTESDELLVEKKAEELLKELEEFEEVLSVEDAGKTLEELVEELEDKEEYSPEDAKKFLLLIEQTIKSYAEAEEES